MDEIHKDFDKRERDLCISMIKTLRVDDLIKSPEVFNISENLLIRKYKTMLYDDKRREKIKEKRIAEGKQVYVYNKRPERMEIEGVINRLKIKLAVKKKYITLEQGAKYFAYEENNML